MTNFATLTSGVHPSIPFPDYLNHPGWGSSDLRHYRRLPGVAKWNRDHRDEAGDTPATRIGKAAHSLILTPKRFSSECVIKPAGMTFQSKENKARRDEWLSQGMTILSHEEGLQIEAVATAFMAKPSAAASLANAEAREATVLWRDAESGLQRKCRPDWFDSTATYDLKVSIEATKDREMLMRRCEWNGWLHQGAGARAGLIANGYEIECARLVVIAPNPPQALQVWLLELNAAQCDELELHNIDTCRRVAHSEKTNDWPGTPDEWQPIELSSASIWTEEDMPEENEECPL